MVNLADMFEEERDMAWFKRALNGYPISGFSVEQGIIAELATYCIWI